MFGQFTIPGRAGCNASSIAAIACTLAGEVVVIVSDGVRPGWPRVTVSARALSGTRPCGGVSCPAGAVV
jgi:hypothetical protein